jgi:FtsP/CotA-like multicopper oxidase with cupredoxin domain
MRDMKNLVGSLLRSTVTVLAAACAVSAHAAAPGVTGSSAAGTRTFGLIAAADYISQPDGASIYSWGYGCSDTSEGFAPATITTAVCPAGKMQLPGPTLIVNEGETVVIKLSNNLPVAAGNTSMIFPGFTVTASTPQDASLPGPACTTKSAGVLTTEAVNGCTVTYTFKADKPGTHSYYSGTQADLQVEMGLFGALIVLPASTANGGVPSAGAPNLPNTCRVVGAALNGDPDYRLAPAAYNNTAACYDREYLFQFSEMDPAIHRQAEEQSGLACAQSTGCMVVATEPYHPAYFMINGRSMPDDMDPNYASPYPHQPYNGNPHMHPGELTLLRIIGQGRMQHPFHEHANHVRLLARDGNLLLTASSNNLAGPLLFTTSTTPGQTMDGIFQWTGKGLNWDVYAHVLPAGAVPGPTPTGNPHTDPSPCFPDANGYYTANAANKALNYFEWCADHGKPLESKPFGNVGSGGPVTLPDPNILANGAWYGGSPYLGPEATARAVGSTPIPPSGTVANSPSGEAGFAFMWHSHNEREITTNNIFPGGMMMMMLVDPWQQFVIDEAK